MKTTPLLALLAFTRGIEQAQAQTWTNWTYWFNYFSCSGSYDESYITDANSHLTSLTVLSSSSTTMGSFAHGIRANGYGTPVPDDTRSNDFVETL